MSAAQGTAGRDLRMGHAARDIVSKRIIVGYGFWIFLLSDIIMFSAFFAAYAVLSGQTAGGPSGRDVFHLHIVAIETACLLLSSFTCGIASIGARATPPDQRSYQRRTFELSRPNGRPQQEGLRGEARLSHAKPSPSADRRLGTLATERGAKKIR